MDASSGGCRRTPGAPAAAVPREGDRDPLDFGAWLREVSGGACSLDGYVEVLEREFDTVPQVLSIYRQGSAFAEDKFFEDAEVGPAHHALFRAWFEGPGGGKVSEHARESAEAASEHASSAGQASDAEDAGAVETERAYGGAGSALSRHVCRAYRSHSDAYGELDGGVAEPHPDEHRAAGLCITSPDPAGFNEQSWVAPELTSWLRGFGDDDFAAREHLLVHFSCVDDVLRLYSEGGEFLREDFFEDFEVFEEDHKYAFDAWFQGALASRDESSGSHSAAPDERREALEEPRATSKEDAQVDEEPREVFEERTTTSAESVQVGTEPDASGAGGTDTPSGAIPDDSLHPPATDLEQTPFNKLIAPNAGGCKPAKPAIAGA